MDHTSHSRPARFLIIGAGGIGAYYGARLQSAGHRVTYLARGEQLAALRRDGLSVRHPDFTFADRVDAVTGRELVSSRASGDYALALLATKSAHTEPVMAELGTWLRAEDGPAVLSLQNGVDNEGRIADAIGLHRTIGGLAVRIGGHVVSPGVIEARGPGQVILGAWPTAEDNPAAQTGLPDVVEIFCRAGIPTSLTEDIRFELWKKLMINNGVNPLSVLTETDTRAVSNDPVFGPNAYRMMQETAAAAAADGVTIGQDDVDAMFELIRSFEPIKTSMLVDFEKGRPLEIDEIAGAVVERCRATGRAAPVTELVMALVREKVRQRDA
jgi:2-dehydropantoate 2-reductase